MSYEPKPKIKVCSLWENTTKDGTKKYFTGYWGGAKVIIFKDDRADKDNVWTMFLEESPPKPKPTERKSWVDEVTNERDMP